MDEIRMQCTVENIERILHQFYNDVHSQAQANQFLMFAQSSPEAWTFAWQLLDRSKPHEAQFFGASTLQAKITKNWAEVPCDQYNTLRTRLMQTLLTYAVGPRVIFTRLCIAMSSFVIKTMSDFWPSAVSDLMTAFNSADTAHCDTLVLGLLELLTILVEEFNTTHLSASKKSTTFHSLQTSLDSVMKYIEEILKHEVPLPIKEMALKCYSSWALLDSSVLTYEHLLLYAFDAVHVEELCQTALEALCNIATHSEAHKYPKIILTVFDRLSMLGPLLSRSRQDDDMDKLCSIYSLILTVCEHHSKLLLDTVVEKPEKRNMIMHIIQYILLCSGTPGQYPVDEICSEQAFGFWYTLQDGIVSSEPHKFEALLLVFHPVYQALLDTYLVKLRYPSDEEYQQWKADEQESFRCYRQDIGDSIMFCYNILRQAALANLMAHLTIATNTVASNASQWQYLEACLFAFKEVAESVDLSEQCYIPQFMSQLPNIPLQHLRVISVCMEAVGAYAEWINKHPDVLGYVVPLLLMGIQNAEVAPSASFALKDITRDCHFSLRSFAEQILVAIQEALKGNILKSRERVRLMSTIGQVLSVMPFSYIMSFLDSLLTPVINQLQQYASQPANPSNYSMIVLHLHMLAMLFATLDIKKDREPDEDQSEEVSTTTENKEPDTPQPTLLIMQKVMPVFAVFGTGWDANEQITEALCDALKRAVSTLLDDSKILVPDLINLISQLYKRCPHSSVLDMAKQILLIFVDDKSQRSVLSIFFTDICDHTVQFTAKDFREHTSVIEIFLSLLTQIIRKAFIFFRSESLNHSVLFEYGVAALSLPEKQTVKAASSFITEFVTHSREVPNMLNAVNNQGEMLVAQVLKVIAGESPRSVVEFMPDILMALNKKYFDNLCRWMSVFSQQDNSLIPRINQEQKEHFIRLVLKERTNKRKLKDTISEFSLMCRGLINSEYAVVTSQSLLS